MSENISAAQTKSNGREMTTTAQAPRRSRRGNAARGTGHTSPVEAARSGWRNTYGSNNDSVEVLRLASASQQSQDIHKGVRAALDDLVQQEQRC